MLGVDVLMARVRTSIRSSRVGVEDVSLSWVGVTKEVSDGLTARARVLIKSSVSDVDGAVDDLTAIERALIKFSIIDSLDWSWAGDGTSFGSDEAVVDGLKVRVKALISSSMLGVGAISGSEG